MAAGSVEERDRFRRVDGAGQCCGRLRPVADRQRRSVRSSGCPAHSSWPASSVVPGRRSARSRSTASTRSCGATSASTSSSSGRSTATATSSRKACAGCREPRAAVARARLQPGSRRRRRNHGEDAHRVLRVDVVGHCWEQLCPVAERQRARSAAQDVRRTRHGEPVRRLDADRRGAGSEWDVSGRLEEWRPDQYVVWTTDSNGNFLSQSSVQTAAGLQYLEPAFNQDFNGGGVATRTPIEFGRLDGAGQRCQHLRRLSDHQHAGHPAQDVRPRRSRRASSATGRRSAPSRRRTASIRSPGRTAPSINISAGTSTAPATTSRRPPSSPEAAGT